MHNALTVHVLQGGGDLYEIFPNGAFGNQTPLSPEVVKHTSHVPSVCQLQHDVQLVVLDKRCQVFYHVRMIKLLKNIPSYLVDVTKIS